MLTCYHLLLLMHQGLPISFENEVPKPDQVVAYMCRTLWCGMTWVVGLPLVQFLHQELASEPSIVACPNFLCTGLLSHI